MPPDPRTSPDGSPRVLAGPLSTTGFKGDSPTLNPYLRSDDFPANSIHHYLKYLMYAGQEERQKALTELILSYQTNPTARELLREIVETALDLNQVEIAALYAHIARQIAPQDAESLWLEAQILEAKNQHREALSKLIEAYKLDSQNPDILLSLAALYARTDDRKKALETLNTYLKIWPGNTDLLKIKGYYQMEQNDHGAIETFQQAYQQDTDDPEILEGLLGAVKRMGTQQELKTILKDASDQDAPNNRLKLKICALMGEQQEKQNCLQEALNSDPTSREALGLLLETLEEQGAWEEALWTLREYPAVTEKEPVFALKESFYLLQSGNLPEAVVILEQAQARFAGNDDIGYFLALGYQDLNEPLKARNKLEEIYQKKPAWKEASYNYALLCGDLGDRVKMEEILQALWRSYPDDPVVANALGYTWAERGKNLDQALGLIEKAVATDPKNPSYQDSWAWALFKMGRTAQALEILGKTAQETRDPEILMHLSQAQDKEGKKEEAWVSYLLAKFSLTNPKKKNARLAAQLSHLEKSLDRNAKPSAGEILGEQFARADQGLSGAFRCQWNLKGQKPLRVRLSFESASEKEAFRVFYWPPGAFLPLKREEIEQNFPQSSGVLTEFESAMEDFFAQRAWFANGAVKHGQAPQLKWKVGNDYSVRARGPKLLLKFFEFYSDHALQSGQGAAGGLVPRQINLESGAVSATCESLGYAKE
ncbi:MAG: tetratricopeptide repeat protein [Elusimicrobia bacterium]|nr:tetratricopeptide repeat protein [Elusimicrobiota bacterium]